MITFMASLFIKDSKNYKEPSVRQAYGVLSGAVGIGLNILLFFGKWLAIWTWKNGIYFRSSGVRCNSCHGI